MTHKKKIILSVVFALIAALFFALMSALNKVARTELSTEMALFFRFSIGFIVCIPFFLATKSFSLKTSVYKFHLTRSIFAFLGIYCLVYPIKFIPLVNVVLLGITYPLFVPLLIFFFFRKRLSLKMILGIVLGFIGVVFVLQPDRSRLFDLYSFIAVLGGFFIAVALIIIRKLHKTESSEQISFFYLLQAAVIATILALFSWQWPSAKMWPIVIGIGITGAIYQQFLTYALRYAHASLVSPLMYASIPFSVILELGYWGIIPNGAVWLGFALIFAGACITVFIQGQADTLTRKAASKKETKKTLN